MSTDFVRGSFVHALRIIRFCYPEGGCMHRTDASSRRCARFEEQNVDKFAFDTTTNSIVTVRSTLKEPLPVESLGKSDTPDATGASPQRQEDFPRRNSAVSSISARLPHYCCQGNTAHALATLASYTIQRSSIHSPIPSGMAKVSEVTGMNHLGVVLLVGAGNIQNIYETREMLRSISDTQLTTQMKLPRGTMEETHVEWS